MRAFMQAPAARAIIPGVLAAGWLVGLVGQRQIAVDTGYLDVSPPLLLLGLLLFLFAGMSARVLLPNVRRRAAGALAGVAVLAAILVGYGALILLYIDPSRFSEGGETWFSLLLESWFWIGVPLLLSSGLGAVGWWLADRVGR
jgi:hypothetical protein